MLDKLHKEYVKEYHLTGMTWNFKPGSLDAKSFSAPAAPPAAPAAAAPAAAAAPPAAAAAADAGGIGALGDALRAKGNATSGLKTVTKDMQTWRADYKGGDKPAPVAKPKVAPRAKVIKTKGTKQCEFKHQGMRWCVEAQTSDDGVVEVAVTDTKVSKTSNLEAHPSSLVSRLSSLSQPNPRYTVPRRNPAAQPTHHLIPYFSLLPSRTPPRRHPLTTAPPHHVQLYAPPRLAVSTR